MKLLRIIRSFNIPSCGPVEGIKQISPALAALGHHTDILTLDPPETRFEDYTSGMVHNLGPGAGLYGFAPHVIRWLKNNAPAYDAIFVHGLWQFHGISAFLSLKKNGYFVYPHGMLDPWFAKRFPLKHLKKSLYWHIAEKRVLDKSAGILFTSQKEKERAEIFLKDPKRAVVIRYGVARPGGSPTDQMERFFSFYPLLRNKRILLFMGRLHEKKGLDMLINAAVKLDTLPRETRIVIAGPDESGYLTNLKKLAAKYTHPDMITFTGELLGDMKWGAFRAAEAFILPSHQENFGIVCAEALGCGRPVLTTDKVNICDRIAGCKAGLVETDSAEGVKTLIEKWFSLTENDRKIMRENAEVCFDEFDVKCAAQNLIEVLGTYGIK